MEFEKTSIELLGIVIQEPVTAVTDLLVSAVCFYAFASLQSTQRSIRSVAYLRYYFLTMGIATAFGGLIGHAFLDYLSFGWKLPGWIISMFSVALLERTAIAHAKPLLSNRTGKLFMWLNGIELTTLLVIVLMTLQFRFVEAHAAYGLLVVVFSFELFVFKMTRTESSGYFLLAVGISALAALVHLTGLTLHKWFNHLDLSHVLMACAAYVFLLAGRELAASPMVHSLESLPTLGGRSTSRVSSGTVTFIKRDLPTMARYLRKRYATRDRARREVA